MAIILKKYQYCNNSCMLDILTYQSITHPIYSLLDQLNYDIYTYEKEYYKLYHSISQ